MRTSRNGVRSVLTMLTALSISLLQPSGQAADEAKPAGQAPLEWPREFDENGGALTLYQPQVESWDGAQLKFRMAVAIQKSDKDPLVYGTVWLQCRADVDKAANIVTCNDVKIVKSNFPTVPQGQQADYPDMVWQHLSKGAFHLSLDDLEASYAVDKAVDKMAAAQVENTPPLILYSATPALLVLVDGAPVLRPTKVAGVERVINTPALILKTAGRYYLAARNRWYQATDLEVAWSVIDSPPAALEAAKKDAVAEKRVDLLPPPPDAPPVVPVVYLSTVPTELLQTAGAPELVPVQNTKLLEVKNSDSAIFMNISSQEYFVLISGRWFKSKSLTNGSWEWVAGKDLPADFAKILESDPKGNVLVSVPKTPQAQEAVIANSIPQTATIKRADAKLTLEYDGKPDFKKIAGTTLSYAANTPTPVIMVDPKNYYAVENGVWFAAAEPLGPWTIATTVPASIYTIPPSCPLHYVTYVRVEGSTPEVVYTSYTPGYMGTIVTPEQTIVYGTGYTYAPYIGAYWIGCPVTYGYGAGFACSAAAGFAFGFATGAFCHPWWGAYGWGWHNGICYGNVSINHTNIYHNWGGCATYSHSYGYNSWTGKAWSGSWGSNFNPYSGRSSSWERGAAANVYNGNYAAGRQGASYNPRTGNEAAGREGVAANARTGNYAAGREGVDYNSKTGIGVAGKETATGNAYTGNRSTSKEGAVFDTKTDSGIAEKNGEVYADKDGNIYRHSDNGWQKYSNGNWQNTQRPQQNAARPQSGELNRSTGEEHGGASDLDRERNSRQIGSQRASSYHGGGGYRGGGGHGGRR